MKVLLLSRYGNLGASSRVRAYQYLPYLHEQGINVTRAPLLPDEYLHRLYAGERPGLAIILSAYLRRIGTLIRREKFDLLWIEYELFPWLPGLFETLTWAKGAPYLVDYDDAVFHRYDRHANPVVRKLLGGKIDGVMRRAALVVVGNEYLRERAVAAGSRRVEMLPTSIDLARYTLPARADNDSFTIGWIGSPATTRYLDRVHGALAEVCAHHPAKVVLVGASDPSWQDLPYDLRAWSEASEVAEIGKFDVGIMPLEDSPWERGKCGYKLIQYMACGKPVIASPVGINPWIVEPGNNGYLAETKQDWVRALLTLMGDADLRWRLGAAGRGRVEREFTIQVNAPRLAAMLREAVSCAA